MHHTVRCRLQQSGVPRKVNDYDAEKSGFTRHVNVGTEDVLYEISCPMAKAPGYTTDWVMQLNLVPPARGQAAASRSTFGRPKPLRCFGGGMSRCF